MSTLERVSQATTKENGRDFLPYTDLDLSQLPTPVVREYNGVHVVREDMLPGGTKLRYMGPLALAGYRELVYASSAQGGAQLALAYAASIAGIKATLFVARRAELHARTLEAIAAGAKLVQIEPGYLTVVQARAREYAHARAKHGAFHVAFGGDSPDARLAIANAARVVDATYGPFDEVWCAAGSGVLSGGLQTGFPHAQHVAVCCGHAHDAIGSARLEYSGVKYGRDERDVAPFDACPTYERKAWKLLQRMRGEHPRDYPRNRRVLFWNVLGQSPTPYARVFARHLNSPPLRASHVAR
jgi:hypothetical protein